MDRKGDSRQVVGFRVNVVAAIYTLQLPAMFFEQPRKNFPAYRFQTAISSTLSFFDISMCLRSTDRHPMTAS